MGISWHRASKGWDCSCIAWRNSRECIYTDVPFCCVSGCMYMTGSQDLPDHGLIFSLTAKTLQESSNEFSMYAVPQSQGTSSTASGLSLGCCPVSSLMSRWSRGETGERCNTTHQRWVDSIKTSFADPTTGPTSYLCVGLFRQIHECRIQFLDVRCSVSEVRAHHIIATGVVNLNSLNVYVWELRSGSISEMTFLPTYCTLSLKSSVWTKNQRIPKQANDILYIYIYATPLPKCLPFYIVDSILIPILSLINSIFININLILVQCIF